MSETATEQAAETAQGVDFDGDFDADKAKKLIEGLRADKRKLQTQVRDNAPALARLTELERAQQTEAERQSAALSEATKRAEQAEQTALRASVALAKGLPANLAARLQGTDQAALEADADELLALVARDTSPRAPRLDPSQGSSSSGGGTAQPRDQFAALMGQMLNQASTAH